MEDVEVVSDENSFRIKMFIVLEHEDIDTNLEVRFKLMLNKLSQLQEKDSSWTIQKVYSI